MKQFLPSVAIMWLLAAIVLYPFSAAAQTAAERQKDEQILCPIDWDDQVFVSPTGKHIAISHDSFKFTADQARAIRARVATAGKNNSKALAESVRLSEQVHENAGSTASLIFDGKPQFPIKSIGRATFSSDGEHFLYSFTVGKGAQLQRGYIALDGIVQKPFSFASPLTALEALYFSPDSKLWVAVINHGTNRFAVINGGSHDYGMLVGSVELQPGGHDYAFHFTAEEAHFVRYNTKTFGPYSWVDAVQFSAEGKHFGYFARRRIPGDMENFVMIDGKECFKTNRGIRHLTLSDAGSHYAFILDEPNSDHRIYLDGKPLKSALDRPQFTRRGQLVYFAITNWNNLGQQLVVGGREWKDCVAQNLIFSPDRERMVCIAPVTRGNANRQAVVLDGKVITEGDLVYNIAFSPDGKRLAFEIRDQKQKFIYNTGEINPLPMQYSVLALKFSPAGEHLAEQLQDARIDGNVMRLDGKALPVPGKSLSVGDNIKGMPGEFSPDSRYFFYMGRDKDNQTMVVRNETAGDAYKRVLAAKTGQWIWFENNEARYFVVCGTNAVSIREKLQ
jgi:hypothetical protein